MTQLTRLATAFGLLAAIGLTALDARADWRHRHFRGPVLRGGVYYGHWGHGYTSPYGYWHSSSIRRHHGLGEAGYCHEDGVRRFHGLGEDPCYRPPTYWWVAPAPLPPPPPQPAPRRFAPPPDPQSGASPPVPGDATSFAQTSRAWASLERGEARAARRDFAVLALRTPEDVIPKVGFALASAMLADDGPAIWAMRRAFEVDAPAVARLVAMDRMALRLRPLIARYELISLDPERGTEGLFMSAALYLLSGADEQATAAISEALERGDREPGTLALRDLLEAGPPPPDELRDADTPEPRSDAPTVDA